VFFWIREEDVSSSSQGWLLSIVGLCAVLLAPSSCSADLQIGGSDQEVGATKAALPVSEAKPGGPRPVIVVRETRKESGVVEEGTVVPFQFEVTNRGQADLEITQVKPSCGCTVTQWDRVIKPGARGIIAAQMNTLSFRDKVTKHLTIFSNDPDRPQVDLTISASLLPLVKISPGRAAVLAVADKAVSQEFTLERNGGRPMKIVQVIPYASYLKAETTPLPGQGRYRLTVTASPDAPLGRSTAAVAVWTDVEKGGSLTFVITVDRGIVTVPPMLFFGIVPQEMKTPREALATIQRKSTPFHIKSITVNDPNLAAKLETVREGAEYRVTVSYSGGWDPGVRRETLTVTTDDPKQPVIEIPVRAAVQAKIANKPPVATH